MDMHSISSTNLGQLIKGFNSRSRNWLLWPPWALSLTCTSLRIDSHSYTYLRTLKIKIIVSVLNLSGAWTVFLLSILVFFNIILPSSTWLFRICPVLAVVKEFSWKWHVPFLISHFRMEPVNGTNPFYDIRKNPEEVHTQ